MHIVCSDLEGVFVPEIWINVAEKTGIKELRLTTRDISDYDVLMKRRLAILEENGLKIDDITAVIATMDPLEGAVEFLDWVRSHTQIIVVSDTFDQFAGPLMKKLGWPTLFCHTLSLEPDGFISGYVLRQKDSKRETVISLKNLNYKTMAVGDSYNDITMLKEADNGILFNPPDNVKNEYPDFPVSFSYESLKDIIENILSNSSG
ncbi:MAG: bifunctional phosphoserine phosphatase/homoserine phosphotransferase ThrH [Deltaproteobacteria bacterium]|jgi:phosphoserine/homoserine phosphotransferase|nr:bifunctional phosphoserine phosphatase/homoserine phosphotransferase ThrH [Deltaproteobacteria bacterium]MBW2238905.1 bifunctional phosphoserine phosphatase/homoserine phosphotransferase ThrH [Deltaproteobacteria bacterium]MBW2572895.1 bifunctional phosphoserine phosphatase/homoserine phosphotransferase ThrH [Deltaproteobacteria bacterium]MBW2669594.1 bifunctional phosphoserine phosphatase/homoserine phosphotransferase ThrH [Deltaproteobacteria bacterium]MBW2710999.1 bifunctional phosphoseri